MRNFVPSLIRTYVPLAVSWLAGYLLTVNVVISDENQTALATGLGAVVAAVYYALVRVAEKRFPFLSVLLGSATQPAVYVNHATVSEARGRHSLEHVEDIYG